MKKDFFVWRKNICTLSHPFSIQVTTKKNVLCGPVWNQSNNCYVLNSAKCEMINELVHYKLTMSIVFDYLEP